MSEFKPDELMEDVQSKIIPDDMADKAKALSDVKPD
jgi:hypothetical protein